MHKWHRKLRNEVHHHGHADCRCGDAVDEILELAWMCEEEGESSLASLTDRIGEGFAQHFEEAVSAGLIETSQDGFELLPLGRERAKEIIRRHRLTEVLLTQLFDLDDSVVETDACRFEHILSPQATESVCTLLGHPPTCPHGKPIPRGECCEMFSKDVTPLVTALLDLKPGDIARIVFITPKSHAVLDRLTSLGITPGSDVRLHQKRPTCVIQVGETDIAIDANVAKEIFVKRV